MDPTTFAPIDAEITRTLHASGVRTPPALTQRFRISTYEQIPLTAATAKLLTIPRDANTKVIYLTKTHTGLRHVKCFPKAAYRKCQAQGILP